MILHLVYCRNYLAFLLNALEPFREEVRYSDRPYETILVQLLEGLPGVYVVIEIGARPVYEIEVYIVEAQGLQGIIESLEGVLISVGRVPELRGDEHVLSVHSGGSDGLSDLLLTVDLVI